MKAVWCSKLAHFTPEKVNWGGILQSCRAEFSFFYVRNFTFKKTKIMTVSSKKGLHSLLILSIKTSDVKC